MNYMPKNSFYPYILLYYFDLISKIMNLILSSDFLDIPYTYFLIIICNISEQYKIHYRILFLNSIQILQDC